VYEAFVVGVYDFKLFCANRAWNSRVVNASNVRGLVLASAPHCTVNVAFKALAIGKGSFGSGLVLGFGSRLEFGNGSVDLGFEGSRFGLWSVSESVLETAVAEVRFELNSSSYIRKEVLFLLASVARVLRVNFGSVNAVGVVNGFLELGGFEVESRLDVGSSRLSDSWNCLPSRGVSCIGGTCVSDIGSTCISSIGISTDLDCIRICISSCTSSSTVQSTH
jgi:hypothetical protein